MNKEINSANSVVQNVKSEKGHNDEDPMSVGEREDTQ